MVKQCRLNKVSEKITRREWNTLKKHQYTSIIKGHKYILRNLGAKGTCLVPVIVKKSPKKR